jgi:hypothetical protein
VHRFKTASTSLFRLLGKKIMTTNNWPTLQPLLLADAARCANLPRATCGKVNLSTANSSGTNLISAALSLPEGRIYGTPHSVEYSRTLDVHSLQMAMQTPSLGSGVARTNGSVLFPDGDIMPVPANSTACIVLNPATETGVTVATGFPGNYAYCGGALWTDGESALLAPHSARYARLVNKNTGAVTDLTGYTFTGQYACAGVRRVGVTGEYLFVPHSHNKFVLLDPETMVFRELPFSNLISDAFVSAVNLNDGRMYVAAHWAPNSVVIDVVAGTKVDTLPPSGAGYVAPITQANFRSCVRLIDGRVLLVPFKHSKAWVYDPVTNKHTQCAGTYGNGDVACGALTSDGETILMPWNGGYTYKLSCGYGFKVSSEVLSSPFFNGF